MQAYADAHGDRPFSETESIRNLDFRAHAPVIRDDAVAIMREACPGYNEFKPDLLNLLPVKAQVLLAREGSVCIYVSGELPANPLMLADEWNYYPESDQTRIWWD
jgi:hypothetical protein